ncbi:hypothetical protein [Catalinimonas niigatensis]|uniref:hypothetical protein n=1 Tax=Catalinimonas niigatensis TaxID=1397264 RepID=UPI002666378B|nr:hypothetical protein [Catalinimonas niigatensis]WPP49328.1 hypothetical protein PZB72_21910 [Catalinimonas niigatensis]
MKTCFLTFCTLLISLISVGSIHAQPSIVVKGTYDQKEILNQALHYAEILGLDKKTHIIISFTHNINPVNLGYTQYQSEEVLGGWHQIYIRINKRKRRSVQMITLAHEMVHAQQFVMGKLKLCNNDQYSWRGSQCTDLRNTAYHERPWEREAQATSVKLYDQYKTYNLMAMRSRRNDP